MPMTEELAALGRSNELLRQKIAALDEHLTIAEDLGKEVITTSDRTKRLTKWAIGLAVLSLVATFGAFYSVHTACVNTNAARAGDLAIWQVVLNANASQQTPKQRAQAKAFDAFVRQVDAPHNCNEPWKTYPLPPAPRL